MTKLIQYVCGTCGSANVNLDAWAEWDPDCQAWVLSHAFDDAFCDVCDGESTLSAVDFNHWLADTQQPQIMSKFGVHIDVAIICLNSGMWESWVTDIHTGKVVWKSGDEGRTFHDPEDAKDAARNAVVHERLEKSS